MTGGHFLGEEDRAKLIALALDGLALDELAASRVTRRANAGVLLDGGWNCRAAAAALAFLRGKIPRSRADLRHPLTGNFRGMPPKDFRVVA